MWRKRPQRLLLVAVPWILLERGVGSWIEWLFLVDKTGVGVHFSIDANKLSVATSTSALERTEQ